MRLSPILRGFSGSLSARRAWIEIMLSLLSLLGAGVALRKESVDRNAADWLDAGSLSRSLSARRAWIEIGLLGVDTLSNQQSLSARRAWIEISTQCRL